MVVHPVCSVLGAPDGVLVMATEVALLWLMDIKSVLCHGVEAVKCLPSQYFNIIFITSVAGLAKSCGVYDFSALTTDRYISSFYLTPEESLFPYVNIYIIKNKKNCNFLSSKIQSCSVSNNKGCITLINITLT
jgi:hypothetical protein